MTGEWLPAFAANYRKRRTIIILPRGNAVGSVRMISSATMDLNTGGNRVGRWYVRYGPIADIGPLLRSRKDILASATTNPKLAGVVWATPVLSVSQQTSRRFPLFY